MECDKDFITSPSNYHDKFLTGSVQGFNTELSSVKEITWQSNPINSSPKLPDFNIWTSICDFSNIWKPNKITVVFKNNDKRFENNDVIQHVFTSQFYNSSENNDVVNFI